MSRTLPYTCGEIEREIYSAAANMRCHNLQDVKAYYCIGDDKMHAAVLYNDKGIGIIIENDWSLTDVWLNSQKELWKYFSLPFMEFDHQ